MLCFDSSIVGIGIEDIALLEGFDKFLCSAFLYGAITSAGVAVTVFYSMIAESKEKFWLYPLISTALSVILGVIFALIATIVPSIMQILTYVAFGISLIFGIKSFSPLFTEIIAHKTKRTAHKSSSSSTTRSSSSTSSYKSNSSSSYSSTSSSNQDTRKNGGDSRFNTAMYSIAKNNSGFQTALYGSSSIYFNVQVYTYVPMTTMGRGRVTFKIGGDCRLSKLIQSEYDVKRIKEDIQSESQRLAERLTSEASRKIEELRNTYKGYDCEFSIDFEDKGVNFKHD